MAGGPETCVLKYSQYIRYISIPRLVTARILSSTEFCDKIGNRYSHELTYVEYMERTKILVWVCHLPPHPSG